MLNLIYFHYGNIPEYFYDNLHQVLSINNNNTTIYILTNEKNFENIKKKRPTLAYSTWILILPKNI